jgi:hypothetical protein
MGTLESVRRSFRSRPIWIATFGFVRALARINGLGNEAAGDTFWNRCHGYCDRSDGGCDDRSRSRCESCSISCPMGPLPSLDDTQQEILRALAGAVPEHSRRWRPSPVSISPGPSSTDGRSTSGRALHSTTVLGCPSSRQPDRFRDEIQGFRQLILPSVSGFRGRLPRTAGHAIGPGRQHGDQPTRLPNLAGEFPCRQSTWIARQAYLCAGGLPKQVCLDLRSLIRRFWRRTAIISMESTSEAGR